MSPGRRHHALSLAETVVAMVLTGILVVAALNTVSAARLSQRQIGLTTRGQQLAAALWAEIEPLAYEDPNTPGTLGPESGEDVTVRRTLNDVDDFAGLVLDPVTDPNGDTWPAFAGWSCRIDVALADPADPNQSVQEDRGLKRIRVETWAQDRCWTTLTGLKARLSGSTP